jgi:hypothetical protein
MGTYMEQQLIVWPPQLTPGAPTGGNAVLGHTYKRGGLTRLQPINGVVRELTGDGEVMCPYCGTIRVWEWRRAHPAMKRLER